MPRTCSPIWSRRYVSAARIADAVTARFISGSAAVAFSSTQLPLAISLARMWTHRQPRSLRLSSAPEPVNGVQQRDDRRRRRRRRLAVEQRGQQCAAGKRHPLAVDHRPRGRMMQSLALQPNTPDLAGVLEMLGDDRPGCAAHLGDRGRRRQRPAGQQREGGVHDGVQRHRACERDQPSGRDGFAVHRRPDAAQQRQIQQHRRREHSLTS